MKSESRTVKVSSMEDSAVRGNGGDGGSGFTGGTEKRRRTEGRSIGRRAKHADGHDVRERKYKPLIAPRAVCICVLVHRGRPPSAANRTAAALRALGVLCGKDSVRLRFSVPPVNPFPPQP